MSRISLFIHKTPRAKWLISWTWSWKTTYNTCSRKIHVFAAQLYSDLQGRMATNWLLQISRWEMDYPWPRPPLLLVYYWWAFSNFLCSTFLTFLRPFLWPYIQWGLLSSEPLHSSSIYFCNFLLYWPWREALSHRCLAAKKVFFSGRQYNQTWLLNTISTL